MKVDKADWPEQYVIEDVCDVLPQMIPPKVSSTLQMKAQQALHE